MLPPYNLVMFTMSMLEKLKNAVEVPLTIAACNDEQLLEKLQLLVN